MSTLASQNPEAQFLGEQGNSLCSSTNLSVCAAVCCVLLRLLDKAELFRKSKKGQNSLCHVPALCVCKLRAYEVAVLSDTVWPPPTPTRMKGAHYSCPALTCHKRWSA